VRRVKEKIHHSFLFLKNPLFSPPITPPASPAHPVLTFASRLLLFAVIFCCVNTPDSQTDKGSRESQNNSAAFCRFNAKRSPGTVNRSPIRAWFLYAFTCPVPLFPCQVNGTGHPQTHPQNSPSFPVNRATPPAPLSSAIQKAPLGSFFRPGMKPVSP